MSDLISRDTLLEALNDHKRLIILDGRAALVSGEWGALMRHSDVIEVVASIPSMDAAPLEHGQWLRENIRPKSYLRVCSMCKKTAYFCGEG